MRRLDATLTSPHYLAVFDGGHTLPPDAVANEALEWLELQAIRSGRRAPDRRLIDALFASRLQRIEQAPDGMARLRLLQASLEDFRGLHDVAALQSRVETLTKDCRGDEGDGGGARDARHGRPPAPRGARRRGAAARSRPASRQPGTSARDAGGLVARRRSRHGIAGTQPGPPRARRARGRRRRTGRRTRSTCDSCSNPAGDRGPVPVSGVRSRSRPVSEETTAPLVRSAAPSSPTPPASPTTPPRSPANTAASSPSACRCQPWVRNAGRTSAPAGSSTTVA